MRTWFLGCLSLVSVTFSATAWCAEDASKEDPKATTEPAAPSPAPKPPAAPAGKAESRSASGSAAPSAKGEVRVGASGGAASAGAAASSAAASGGAPSPATTTPSPATAAPSSPKVEPIAAPEGAAGPKPLPEGIAPPMPPENGPLPPLPSAAPGNAPPPYDAPSPLPPPPARRRVEWGTQVRIEGAAKGDKAADNAGMGGIGFSFRPRPSPYFAVDLGIDFLGGRDFNGDKRGESAFTVNPMVFLNPRNTVQVYLFGGLGVGAARVERSDGSQRDYRYLGADGGVGVEMRFWPRVALSADVMAFVRDRIDLKDSAPEYVEARTGRYTDSSAGALLRLGGIYYW